MKFKIAKSDKDVEAMKQWHSWFAWYPVFLHEDGSFVWLEEIEREVFITSNILFRWFDRLFNDCVRYRAKR